MQGQINKQKAKATLAQTKAEAEAEIMRFTKANIYLLIQSGKSLWHKVLKVSFKDELVTIVIVDLTITESLFLAWKRL